jgi:hypothetical protein
LDIARLLHTPAGKPRVSIFSIAHLGDAERMFFVSLLLSQTLAWMRAQSGTTSLRAILYMDEIFGYFPPVANPPSKQPLLTLLKQARAYGLGVVLATQNPVDLDYKGLSNAGTWFIGRLQTERDRGRVLDGLEGAARSALDRREVEQVLSQLGNRIFLMSNVHEDAPVVFETRWVMSYLRGPLTRAQIRTLMASRNSAGEAPAPSRVGPGHPAAATLGLTQRPVLPPGVPQHFAPVQDARAGGGALLYRPALLGSAQVRFVDARAQIDVLREITLLAELETGPVAVDWQNSTGADFGLDTLEREPFEDALYAPLPPAAAKARNYAAWSRDLAAWLYGSQTLELLRSPASGETSRPGESERDFRVRLQQTGREQRDASVEKLRRTYAPRMAALEERVRRAGQIAEREREQASQQKIQAALSVGTTLLGALLGRKVGRATLGRAGAAARAGSRTWKEAQDVNRALDTVESLNRQLADLEARFAAELQTLEAAMSPATEVFDSVSFKPKKTHISVRLVSLCWMPDRQDAKGNLQPPL